MRRAHLAIAVVGAVTASVAPPAVGQAVLLPGWFGTATIFLAEIEALDSPAHPPLGTGVHCRAIRVLKDGHHEGLTPGEFRADLDGNCEYDGSAWCSFGVRAGQRFLVFSNLEGGFAAMMNSPLNAVQVTEEDDAVGDMEMALASTTLPVASQAHAMAAALGAAGGPHSQMLGQYLAGLLAYGPEREAFELAGVVESAAFSERGKGSLLSGLAQRLSSDSQTNERVLSVFATLVPRYFADDSAPVDEGMTAIQRQVLFNYAPLIRRVDGLRTRLRSGVPAPVSRQFRAKLAAIAEDPRVRADGREHAREFVALIGPQ